MPRKPYNREGLLQPDDRLAGGIVSRQRKPVSALKRSMPSPLTTTMVETPESVETFIRTGLLIAALRVWELKNGIHDYF